VVLRHVEEAGETYGGYKKGIKKKSSQSGQKKKKMLKNALCGKGGEISDGKKTPIECAE
jgi:hypothetical protein